MYKKSVILTVRGIIARNNYKSQHSDFDINTEIFSLHRAQMGIRSSFPSDLHAYGMTHILIIFRLDLPLSWYP